MEFGWKYFSLKRRQNKNPSMIPPMTFNLKNLPTYHYLIRMIGGVVTFAVPSAGFEGITGLDEI